MTLSRRRTVLGRAARSAASKLVNYTCEPLEHRRLLDANDPVVVLTEPFALGVGPLTSDYAAH